MPVKTTKKRRSFSRKELANNIAMQQVTRDYNLFNDGKRPFLPSANPPEGERHVPLEHIGAHNGNGDARTIVHPHFQNGMTVATVSKYSSPKPPRH